MCETLFWRLEPRPLPPTPHKHLCLWSDHRIKGVQWLTKDKLVHNIFNINGEKNFPLKFRVDCYSLKPHDQYGAVNFDKCKWDFSNGMTWMTMVIPSLLRKLDMALLVLYIIDLTNGSSSDHELVASNRFIDSSLEALKIDWSKVNALKCVKTQELFRPLN